jgi:hypothetical protein
MATHPNLNISHSSFARTKSQIVARRASIEPPPDKNPALWTTSLLRSQVSFVVMAWQFARNRTRSEIEQDCSIDSCSAQAFMPEKLLNYNILSVAWNISVAERRFEQYFEWISGWVKSAVSSAALSRTHCSLLLSHPSLILSNESDLYADISSHLWDDAECFGLFQFIHFECLSSACISDFIRFNPASIDSWLWAAISRRFQGRLFRWVRDCEDTGSDSSGSLFPRPSVVIIQCSRSLSSFVRERAPRFPVLWDWSDSDWIWGWTFGGRVMPNGSLDGVLKDLLKDEGSTAFSRVTAMYLRCCSDNVSHPLASPFREGPEVWVDHVGRETRTETAAVSLGSAFHSSGYQNTVGA